MSVAWVAPEHEVIGFLARARADRSEAGRLVISGAPATYEARDMIVPVRTVFFVGGRARPLAVELARHRIGRPAAPRPRTNPSSKTIVIDGRPLWLPEDLEVAWLPVNQAYGIFYAGQPIRVVADPEKLHGYLLELGAATVNPSANPSRARHEDAYASYLSSARRHLDVGLQKLGEGRSKDALALLRHAECDIRQAYTEASYASRGGGELAELSNTLEPLHRQLTQAMRQLEARIS